MGLSNALKNIGQQNAVARNRSKSARIFPTGLNKFDNEVLGTGGLVSGRFYELYAKASAGKTSLALKIIAHFQKQQLLCSFIDAEGALSVGDWVKNIGVDIDALIMPEIQTGESAFKIAKTLIASGVNLIAIDTLATLLPETMLARDNELAKMNENQARAKMLTVGLNDIVGGFRAKRTKSTGSEEIMEISPERYTYLTEKCGFHIPDKTFHKLNYYDCVFIGINHAKTMIGVMYGDPTYTPGGDAANFHSSIRIGMSEPLKSKTTSIDPVSGAVVPEFRKTRVTAAKNKLAPPFNEVTLKIYRDGRIVEDVVFWQEAVKLGLVDATAQTVVIKQNGKKFRKKHFELWAVENPDFFQGKVDENSFEAVEEETPAVDEPESKSSSMQQFSIRKK